MAIPIAKALAALIFFFLSRAMDQSIDSEIRLYVNEKKKKVPSIQWMGHGRDNCSGAAIAH